MIILNKMYSGEYLYFNQNIGHEFINEYMDDNNAQYIYVNPKGQIRNLKDGDHYTIQVRYAGSNCYEVLSYAKISQYCKDCKGCIDKKEAGLKYCNISLGELFEGNSENDEIYAHFRAAEFKKCKPNTYLCFGGKNNLPNGATKIDLAGFEFGRRNSRRYVPNKNDEDNYYKTLKDFIDKKDYWLDEKNPLLKSENVKQPEINIIDVIGKQYEELTFSNWLSFYLQNTQLCKKFIECLFKASGVSIEQAKLLDNLSEPQREYNNIDIWIESEQAIIVIENKIDSGINGVRQTEDGNVINQLDNYKSLIEKENKNKQPYYFIIKPNYNQSIGSVDGWHVIEYSKIHEFFDDKSQNDFKDLPYIQEFVKALKPLTQTRKIDYKDIIENRLMERIAALKKEKGNK